MQLTEQQDYMPGITWLNMSGDVTITWDAENREAILELVKEKMAKGYSFFIITPRLLPIFGDKTVKLTDESQLEKAKGIVIPDSQVAEMAQRIANIGDEDLNTVVKSGKARLASPPKVQLNSTRRATSASEVVSNQSVAIRPIVGG